MPYRHLCCVFAALWALSAVSALAQDFNQARLLAELRAEVEKGKKCNPFVEPGCNTPTGDPPFGCTDCSMADLAKLFRTGDGIRKLESIKIDGKTIKFREKLTRKHIDALKMGPQVGF